MQPVSATSEGTSEAAPAAAATAPPPPQPPPTSAASSSSVPAFEWRDITDEFRSAANSLALGELFRDKDFTLLEAMSAIEMMDPKMDAGMSNPANTCSSSNNITTNSNNHSINFSNNKNNNNNNINEPDSASPSSNGMEAPGGAKTLPWRPKQNGSVVAAASVAYGSLKVSGLSALEIKQILDSSLRLLASWLEGHCLAQTVFTNLYLHLRPITLIEDPTLRAISLASIKLVVAIKDVVYRIGAFEDEDFHGVTYNFFLAQDVPDAKIYSLLKECEDNLQRRAKQLVRQQQQQQQQQQQSEHVKAAAEPDSSRSDTDPVTDEQSTPPRAGDADAERPGSPTASGDKGDYLKDPLEDILALHMRLRFLRLLFLSMCAIEGRQGMPSGFGEARRALTTAAESLRAIREMAHSPLDDDDDSFPTTPGFDASLNQRLLPSTFPRHTKVASCRQAYDYLAGMVDRMLEAMQVVKHSGFNQALEFFEEFSKKAPCVLSRCIGQLVYLPQPGLIFGVTETTDVLKEAVRAFCRPPVLLAKTPLSQVAECRAWVNGLLLRCVHPVFGVLQAMGHNRARQREKAARLLEDLSLVQEEAEMVDSRLVAIQRDVDPQAPAFQWFSMWLMMHVLRTQIRYLLAGFELELYAVHEYGYIFWYLYEYLYRFLVTVLSQADHYLADCDRRLKRKLKKDPRCQSKVKKLANKGQGYHQKELVLHQAMQNMCGGLYKTMLGLRMDGKLPQPHKEFDTERTRFEHRFAAFRSVTSPPVVSYDQYCELKDLARIGAQRADPQKDAEPGTGLEHSQKSLQHGAGTLSSLDVYAAAARCFTQTKHLLESSSGGDTLSAEQQSLLRLAKHNLVVANLLASGRLPDARVSFDRGQHIYFPQLRLA